MQFDSHNLRKIKDVLYSPDPFTQIRNRTKLYTLTRVAPVRKLLPLFAPITKEKKYAVVPVYRQGKLRLAYSIGLWTNFRHPEILIYFNGDKTKDYAEKVFEKMVEEVRKGTYLSDGKSAVVKLDDEEHGLVFEMLGSELYKSEIPFAVVFYQWFLDDFNSLFPVLKAELECNNNM